MPEGTVTMPEPERLPADWVQSPAPEAMFRLRVPRVMLLVPVTLYIPAPPMVVVPPVNPIVPAPLKLLPAARVMACVPAPKFNVPPAPAAKLPELVPPPFKFIVPR